LHVAGIFTETEKSFLLLFFKKEAFLFCDALRHASRQNMTRRANHPAAEFG